MESQTQFFYTESLVVYIVIQGRLSKSLLSFRRRLSCSDTESPFCGHNGGGVRLSILAESL